MKVLAVILFAVLAVASASPKPAPGILGAGLIAPGLVAPAGVLGVPGILGAGLIGAPGILGAGVIGAPGVLGLGVVPRVVAVPPLGTLAAPQPAAILGHGKILLG